MHHKHYQHDQILYNQLYHWYLMLKYHYRRKKWKIIYWLKLYYLSGYNWTSSILPKKVNKDFNWSLWHVVDILQTWTILLFEITVDI
jgi:hypothetical protein